MRRYAAVVFLVVLLIPGVSVEGQTTPSASDFHIVFDGIIMHFFRDYPLFKNARALIVQGNAMTLRHNPTLVTPVAIDVAALRDATGQPVFCDKEHCRVKIYGYDIRIGTEDEQPAPTSFTPDSYFIDWVPNLQRVTKGQIIGTATDDLPSGPIAGFFELLGDSLTANKFDVTASFYPDTANLGERYFADKVTLAGTVAAGSAACLQIRSATTWPLWQVIKHTSNEPLDIMVVNHSTKLQSNGEPIHSNRHFVLFKKLIGTTGEFPHVCPSDGHGDDDGCPGGHTIVITEAMAGCANSQWP
ncbi:MAG: hypothetical protein QOF63_2331 [Thermoanaerobaculia bacterium]|jgi:hypothetical protein|nr:hypothetical protein [Thermoanaerobaculia bacterium]